MTKRAADDTPSTDTAAQAVVFQALLDKLKPHAPSKALVARFAAQIDDAKAVEYGRSINSDLILEDGEEDIPGVLDAVVEGRVQGFGPKELHYTLSLLVTLADRFRALRLAQTGQARASATKSGGVEALLRERSRLGDVLRLTVGANDPDRAAIEKALARSTRTRTMVLSSLETLCDAADGLLRKAKGDPDLQAYLADKGLRADAIATLRGSLGTFGTQRKAHTDKQGDTAALHAEVDLLDGRARDQLLRLRSAVEGARAKGESLPEVKLVNIRRLGGSGGSTEPIEDEPPVEDDTPVDRG